VQLARFLIDFAGVRAEAMRFDAAGRITDFALSQTELDALIATGKPFRTSGCPGPDDAEISACNRPYGDSPPSAIRSYPFPLQNSDIAHVISELPQEN
jgi:biotin synthase